MFLQTKKVIIIYIVTIITFSSIINTLYRQSLDNAAQIHVISSEELSYNVSFAQNIDNQFSVESGDEEEFSLYGARLFQLSASSSTTLSNIINNSDMSVIIGDTFNDYLKQNIIDNPEKQFVLIENSEQFEYDNVYTINIDYDSAYDAINRVSNSQNQTLLVLSDQYSSLSVDKFLAHKISSNPNVKVEVISANSDISNLNDVISKDLEYGFTNVYSLNPYNNIALIDIITKFNQDNLEAASEEDSEIDSEADKKVEAEPADPATFKYLSLNKNTYNNGKDNENLDTAMYDISKEMNQLIKSTVDGELKHGMSEVSISDMR